VNIAVIGLGSMGKRRIRLLKRLKEDFSIYGIEVKKERARKVQNEYALAGIYHSLDELLQKRTIDAIIICSSPLTHHAYVVKALENGIPTFSEINLSDEKYDEIIRLSQKKQVVAFLSSTFLYRKEIQWIKQNTNPENSFYSYHVGQYLPDWHPWESYKDFFVKDKRTNGCRELMAIEFPWLINVFGEVKTAKVTHSKKTQLKLDYPDVYQILFEHKTGATGSVTIDLVSRKAERALQICSENSQIEWKGTPESLYDYDMNKKVMNTIGLYKGVCREEGYAANIIENAYEEELKAFLNSLQHNKNLSLYSYERDKEILTLINKIEGSYYD